MSASKTFLRFEARCFQEARKTADPELKGFLIEMVHEWRKLAQEVTNIQSSPTATSPQEPDEAIKRSTLCLGDN
jgi:hypothetical protein